MRPCDELLDHLDDAVAGTLPPLLAEHVRTCAECQLELAQALAGSPAAAALPEIRAPKTLVARLKAIPRLAPECDAAMELMTAALDGEIDAEARTRLLDHLHRCPRCLVAWEAFATLREVGAHIRAPRGLCAAIAVPPRHRLELRRRRPVFDMRLATAAAYLLAAATIVLVSNPATVARASSSTMERAGIYARAAVENRFSAYSRRVQETVLAGAGWLRQHGSEALTRGRELLGLHRENPKAGKPVEPSGQGGKQP
jgi:hypothetical protein